MDKGGSKRKPASTSKTISAPPVAIASPTSPRRLRSQVILIGVRDFLSDFVSFTGRRSTAALLGLMLFGGLVEGLSMALLVPLLALLSGEGGGMLQRLADAFFGSLGANTMMARLILIILAFVVAMAVRGAVLLQRDRTVASIHARYVEHRRLTVLQAVASARWEDVASLRHARVTSALSNEVTRVGGAAQLVMQIATSVVMLSAQMALTVAIAPAVGFIAVGLVIASGTFSVSRLRIAEHYGEKMRHGGIALAHTAGQLLNGLKQAAAENRQSVFVASYAQEGADLIEARIAYQKKVTRFRFVMSIAGALAGGLIVIGGAGFGTHGAVLIAAILILSRMAGPAIGLQRDTELLATMMPAHRMLKDIGNELRRNVSAIRSCARPLGGAISLHNVSFRHPGGGGVDNVSLTISPGEVIGIVGHSGAGKTTMLDLMIGLIAPQAGAIHVGTQRLDSVTSKTWRDRVSYASQDTFLTNDTIRANLTAGVDGCTSDEAIWKALAVAQIDAVVRAMPEGLDTRLGERGGRLSGGERQRVAIARALMRRPILLILDEASNAIDIETEDRVLRGLIEANPTTTVIIVSHRTEALCHCTRILTLEAGRLAPATSSRE